MEDSQQVAWIGTLWGGNIFRAFRLAMHPRKMAVAFLAVTMICGLGWLMDWTRSVVVNAESGRTELTVYAQHPEQVPAFITEFSGAGERIGVFAALFRFASDRFHETLYAWFRIEPLPTVALAETVALLRDAVVSLDWAFRFHPWYSVLFFTAGSVVLALAGGAISRMAALQFAQDERPGLVESLRFSGLRLPHFLAALWIPLLIVAVIGAGVVLLGLLGNIPWLGELLIALSMPLVIVAGVIMVFFVVGVGAGAGLLSPAVAYEDSESFTAINNAFRYVYARPWRLGWYGFLAAAYGAMTYLFVRFFAFATLLLCYRFLQLGFLNANRKLSMLWAEPSYVNMVGTFSGDAETWSLKVAGFLIYICVLAVAGIVGSYIFSYYYCVSTIIYALLRHHVDDVPISEIHSQPEEETLEGRASL